MQKGFKAPVVGKRHLTRCTMAIKSRRRRLAMTRDEARLFRLVGKLSGGSNSSMSSSRPSGVISLRAQTGVGVGDSVGRVTRSLSIASSNGRADRLMSNLLASWERLRLVSLKVSGKIFFMLTVLMISTIGYWYARIRGKADANKKPSKPTKAVPKETEVHTADVPGIPVIPSVVKKEDVSEASEVHTVTVTESPEPQGTVPKQAEPQDVSEEAEVAVTEPPEPQVAVRVHTVTVTESPEPQGTVPKQAEPQELFVSLQEPHVSEVSEASENPVVKTEEAAEVTVTEPPGPQGAQNVVAQEIKDTELNDKVFPALLQEPPVAARMPTCGVGCDNNHMAYAGGCMIMRRRRL
eukprot:GHVQ01002615.1.p1 GENE.GHVQ01002615.1~~GHVQ01002615.1.p1  ORF type:complete len:351 (+),score=52.93 GHVQ01002615.1:61-1113(+)